MTRKPTTLTVVALLALAACTEGAPAPTAGPADARIERPPAPTRPRPDDTTLVRAAAVGLIPFEDCASALEHLRARAREIVTAYGIPGVQGGWGFGGIDAVAGAGPVMALAGDGASAAARPDTGAGADFSTTNVQEAGVDEPDLLKSDGRRIFSLARGRLHAVDASGGEPRLAGVLDLPDGGEEMLLAGDRALVFGIRWQGLDGGRGGMMRSTITVVDVGDPASMRVVSTLEIDGSYLSARLVDGVARVVIRSQPQRIAFQAPARGGRSAEVEALAANLRRIRETQLADWLPRYDLFEHRGSGRARVAAGTVGGCDRLHRPHEFGGLGTVSVLSIDPADPEPDEGASVLADASTVYATARSLYVATNRWELLDPAGIGRMRAVEGYTTEIHRFDITDPRRARYRSSGGVRGHLLNQWSLSEHDGALRVATTDGSPWNAQSESFVTVLTERGDRLRRAGQVGGLGRGERIYAVRFLGDVGYVVTFRQVDPLYTIDLSDPARPRVTGELKIPGYSAYLHPVGDDLLLGVGQDATEQGATRGLQVSLFDVSDASAPRRVAQRRLGGHSEAEFDHHAFLWWPAERRVVLPTQSWDEDDHRAGALLLEVTDRSIEQIAMLEHTRGGVPDPGAAIQRAAVIGDSLFTVSQQGMKTSRLRDGADRAWTAWPPRFSSVETLAGSGERGLRDGPAHEARFNRPSAVAVSDDGTIAIADRGNRRIRLLDERGRVREVAFTMAGRPGQQRARLPGRPRGVAFDGDLLYLTTGCALWRLERPGGDAVLRHVAGATAPDGECASSAPDPADGRGLLARFGSAAQIAVARDGSVIVADAGAHAIRRVVAGRDGVGTVSTIAGTLGVPGYEDGAAASALFSSPSSVTLAGGDSVVIVADTGNGMLRRIDVDTGRVRTVARALLDPSGIAFDPASGALFVAEASGTRVRAFLHDRLWAAHAARGGSVESASAVAVSRAGHVMVALPQRNRIALLA